VDNSVLENPLTSIVFSFLVGFLNTKGYAPASKDYVEAGAISSTSVVDRHLTILEEAGMIVRTRVRGRQIGRGIKLSEEAKEMLYGDEKEETES